MIYVQAARSNLESAKRVLEQDLREEKETVLNRVRQMEEMTAQLSKKERELLDVISKLVSSL